MANIVRATLTFVLANYALAFFVVGLIFSAVALLRSAGPLGRAIVVEKLIAWYVFWAVGVYFLYNFVMHGAFGRISAAYIGWPDSPFQFEVATASLGFAAVGFLAAFKSFDLRLAAILGPAIFQLGAAVGHVYQMVATHNFAPGNAGIIFYMDFIIPLFGLFLLSLQNSHRSLRTETVPISS